MARTIRTTGVAFTFLNPADPTYKVTRRLTSLDPTASDEDIIKVAEAFAKLNAGDTLSAIVLTQQLEISR